MYVSVSNVTGVMIGGSSFREIDFVIMSVNNPNLASGMQSVSGLLYQCQPFCFNVLK